MAHVWRLIWIFLFCKSSGGCSLFTHQADIFSCPGIYITFSCTINSSVYSVTTVWSGTAFNCSNTQYRPSNQLYLNQKVIGINNIGASDSCTSTRATLSAITTAINGTCFTSVLTVPAVPWLNGTTVECLDGNNGIVVGNATLNIASPPLAPTNVHATCTEKQLTVLWSPPTTGYGVPTNYSINDSVNHPVLIADNGSSMYTHTFTGLMSDTLYTVSMVAINCAGTSNVTTLTKITCDHSLTANLVAFIVCVISSIVASISIFVYLTIRMRKSRMFKPQTAAVI